MRLLRIYCSAFSWTRTCSDAFTPARIPRAGLRRRCHRALIRRRGRVLPWLFRSRRQRLLRPRRQRLLRHRRQRLLRPRGVILMRVLPTTWWRGWRRPLGEWRRLPAGLKPPSNRAKAVARGAVLGTTKNARGLRCTAQGYSLRAQHRPRCFPSAAGTSLANTAPTERAAAVAMEGLVSTASTTHSDEAHAAYRPVYIIYALQGLLRPVGTRGCFGPVGTVAYAIFLMMGCFGPLHPHRIHFWPKQPNR